MIFGIVGTHCTGKTTFVQRFRDNHTGIPNIGYVHGDLTTDNYPLVPKKYRESKFYRKLEFKKQMLIDMLQDRSKLWIIEGCRFWGSMFHHIGPVVEEMTGGLFMLVVVTSPDLMLSLMKQRAIDNGRMLKVGYWTHKKLEYEARRRHINACSKSLRDRDWYVVEFQGDFSMWNKEPLFLLNSFVHDRSLWYNKFPVTIERTPV